VRSGPGTSSKVLWKLEKYHPIQIIQTNGQWYKFRDFEGDKAWIHDSVVNDTPAVIVKKENCNVRSGPGTNHKVLFRVGRGVPFKVLERQGKWIHIQHSDGDKGWIFESLVW
jgi:SH3-like domain-containing protein